MQLVAAAALAHLERQHETRAALESLATDQPDLECVQVSYVNPVTGYDASAEANNSGKPYKTLAGAYAACVAGKNDVVVLVGNGQIVEPGDAIMSSGSLFGIVQLPRKRLL